MSVYVTAWCPSVSHSSRSIARATCMQLVCRSSRAVGRYRTISADLAHSGQRHVDIGGTTCYTRSSDIAKGPRDASCQLKSCRNLAETTCTTSPERIEVMKLEGYSTTMCNKHVYSTMTRSSRFHCPIGVISKLTTGELCISPVYRRLAVAKFSKSTM